MRREFFRCEKHNSYWRKKAYDAMPWASKVKAVCCGYMGFESVEDYRIFCFVAKYKKLARRATHSNDWIRKIATADLTKSLYENDITSGTCIDGKCISLAAIEKRCGRTVMGIFRDAVKRKKSYISPRFDFCGYDGTLWCKAYPNGDVKAGFSKEYRNCGNGYYYLLINDTYVIGYDID